MHRPAGRSGKPNGAQQVSHCLGSRQRALGQMHSKLLLEPQQEFNTSQTVEPEVAVQRALQGYALQARLGLM